ncbi:MAG: 4-hydroxy-tetrahydrodipicolinate reductase [Chitinophagaceae bacterium]|nr:MAG: 4-hydroxy-tetrahydrodipicolinate reductase [Chitinophagaceae bacterium]
MKIALVGYGKMGKAIEEIAVSRGHEIVLRVGIENLEDNTVENISKADVAIEFTGPEVAFENIKRCLDAGVPVVSGSTGWLKNLTGAETYAKQKQVGFLYSSNFSIGVNIFFALNKKLASLMRPHQNYDVTLTEVHHTQKKDAPSGTAITLAEQVIGAFPVKTKWVNEWTDDKTALSIISERIDPAPGTHTVSYRSEIDDIEIKHTAHNRKGFAGGAVLAAEFLQNKKDVYHMNDVLGIE